ncbi:hypothetical protein BC834DRAFT_689456 [Gloeopeniophorella convolvens]|nr:hypothetical protein BC834DRAFT_689456 [Gloeopeniophorella convolvens]
MDRFVNAHKSTHEKRNGKVRASQRYSPYSVESSNDKAEHPLIYPQPSGSTLTGYAGHVNSFPNAQALKSGEAKLSTTTLTRHLLNTLADESNPITHSDIGLRSDHVVSLATGHQRSDGRGHRTAYLSARKQKLKDQREDLGPRVLSNARIYIDGYLQNTTDIEMKRIVTEAGGQILFVPSLTRN